MPRVPARHRSVKPFPEDVPYSFRSGRNTSVEPVPQFPGDRPENKIRRVDPFRGAADPDPDPQEFPGSEFFRKRAEPVVPSRPAAPFQSHHAKSQVEIVVKYQQVFGTRRKPFVEGGHGPSTEVHVRPRPTEENPLPVQRPHAVLDIPGCLKPDAEGNR